MRMNPLRMTILAMFRAVGTPSNMEAFGEAFGCKPGDAMVREGDGRIVIW